jgi:CheY-like chemotaxis protein
MSWKRSSAFSTPLLGARRQPNVQRSYSRHLHSPRETLHTRRMKILLVEDNETDIWLFQEAFQALSSPHELEVSRDGERALHRLRTGPPPDVILLDINMPKLDGFEVLSAVREHPKLCLIPVIMLSSSRDQRDVRRAHELGANSYLCKSTQDFTDLVGDFDRYWLRRAELPRIP